MVVRERERGGVVMVDVGSMFKLVWGRATVEKN